MSTLVLPPIIGIPKPTPPPKPTPVPPPPPTPTPEPDPQPLPRPPRPYPIPYPVYIRQPAATTYITTPAPQPAEDTTNSWSNPVVILLTVASVFIFAVLLIIVFAIISKIFATPAQEKIIVARPEEFSTI